MNDDSSTLAPHRTTLEKGLINPLLNHWFPLMRPYETLISDANLHSKKVPTLSPGMTERGWRQGRIE